MQWFQHCTVFSLRLAGQVRGYSIYIYTHTHIHMYIKLCKLFKINFLPFLLVLHKHINLSFIFPEIGVAVQVYTCMYYISTSALHFNSPPLFFLFFFCINTKMVRLVIGQRAVALSTTVLTKSAAVSRLLQYLPLTVSCDDNGVLGRKISLNGCIKAQRALIPPVSFSYNHKKTLL